MKWIKAAERMPTKEGRYCVKRLGELMIADAVLRKNEEMVFAYPNRMTWPNYKEFEWLDEEKLTPHYINEVANEYAEQMMGLGRCSEQWAHQDKMLYYNLVRAVAFGMERFNN